MKDLGLVVTLSFCVAHLAACGTPAAGASPAHQSLAVPGNGDADCAAVQTPDQRRDEDTIRRIEHDWLAAEMRGDARFLQCLLTPDYVNMGKDGTKHPGSDVIAHARNNAGKHREVPPIESTIVVNGDAATAYSRSKTRDQAGAWQHVYFVDTFLFRNGAWHPYTGVDL
jgi:ketosteroid isomerase-like protein